MRERAELLGGTLVMRSPPGAGTTVEAYLPLGRKSDE
jgi:signal transduction histidine kinase